MSSFVKGLIVASGIIGGVSAIASGILNSSIPPWKPLSEDSPQVQKPDARYYSTKYADLLVGVGEESGNNAWWNWVHLNRYRGLKISADSGFFGKDNPSSLRVACREAYQGIVESGSDQLVRGSNRYAIGDFWRFCSLNPTGAAPETLDAPRNRDPESPEEEVREMHPTVLANKHRLLSTEEENNGWIWSIRQGLHRQDRTKRGFFGEGLNGRTVRDICAKAYHSESDVALDQDDLLRWCGLPHAVDEGK